MSFYMIDELDDLDPENEGDDDADEALGENG